MSNLVQHRLIGPSGVCRIFCDARCVHRWLIAHTADDHRAVYITDPVRIAGNCAQCSCCGETVAVGSCAIHNDDCPDYDVLYTTAAGEAVAELQRLTGGELPPRAFDYLVKAASAYRLAKVTVSAQLLVERLMDVRVDWERP